MIIETWTHTQQQLTTGAASPHRARLPLEPPALPPYARADGPLARLAAELHRLSSNRDDATAITALALEDQVRTAGTSVTAQTFLRIYVQLYERRWASGDPMRGEWVYAYRLGCSALEALLWAWRLRGRCRATDADRPVAIHAYVEDR